MNIEIIFSYLSLTISWFLSIDVFLSQQVCIADRRLYHRGVPVPATGGGSQRNGAVSPLGFLAGSWQPGSSK